MEMENVDQKTREDCFKKALGVAAVCLLSMIVKKVLKRHYELGDEECMSFNPLSTLGQLGHKEVVTRRRITEDDGICENEDIEVFDNELWEKSIIEMIENVSLRFDEKNQLISPIQIIKKNGGKIWL